jgi:hypothetical protein
VSDTSIARVVQTTTVSLDLPNNMGTVSIRPISTTRLLIQSKALLIEPNLYSFHASMELAGETWYYINKADIGVTGGRPTPKKAQGALVMIAKAVNAALKNDTNFQAQITALKELEEQRVIKAERIKLLSERRQLQRYIEDAQVRFGYAQRALLDRQQDTETTLKDLEAFDLEHPEVRSWD